MLERKQSAHLPTSYGDFNLMAYANLDDEQMPHLALVHKNIDLDKDVVIRIHSECLTGDLFGSLRCDCGEQLSKALEIINKEKGILLYLRQEGRGIGLLNKLRAYNHQDEGMDTIEANVALGFEPDERNYDEAIEMLVDINVKSIKLLTNNPEKLKAFTNAPIKIADRIPLIIDPNETNKEYLKTKEFQMGHILK